MSDHTSFHEWHCALQLRKFDPGFHALLICLALKADPQNRERLELGFPGLLDEVGRRHNAPGGAITEDEVESVERLRASGEMNVLGEVTRNLLHEPR